MHMFNKVNNLYVLSKKHNEAEECSKNKSSHSFEDKKRLAYIESLNQLRMHAPLIWTRNIFFMTFQGAMLAYIFKEFNSFSFFQKVVLCVVGIVSSVAWYVITKEGRTIQRQWRKLAIAKEKEYFQEIEGPLTTASHQIGEGQKLGISITTILLVMTFVFICIWLVLFVLVIVDVFTPLNSVFPPPPISA